MKPAIAPLIARLFEWYAPGEISLKEAAHKAHAAGLVDTRISLRQQFPERVLIQPCNPDQLCWTNPMLRGSLI